MGAVYQATHVLLEKFVCLKILFPTLVHPGNNSVERFLREAQSAAGLEHPNIVRIYDIELDQDVYYIVMEYICGKTVDQILEENNAFTVAEAVRISIAIADALTLAHKNGIIHRDIKPANIMLSKSGEVKLTDFGLAKAMDLTGNITNSNEIFGTSSYLAPEYGVDGVEDYKLDLYSLGVTLFHMLAGEPPYTGRNPIAIIRQHAQAIIPSIRERRSDVPEELERIITALMAKTPDGRPDAAQLVKMLRQLQPMLNRSEPKLNFNPNLLPLLPEEKDKIACRPGDIRVLIVDDSPTIVNAIRRLFQQKPGFLVVGVAANGREALELTSQLQPDVVTLDFNMPEMDGITTLKQIMIRFPRPVIMLSAFTYEGALTTFDCLSCGAIDFIWKSSRSQQRQFTSELVSKVRNAARMKLLSPARPKFIKSSELMKNRKKLPGAPARWVVVMGADAGGYHAYLKIIPYIPKNFPCAVIIVQEMPKEMAPIFAYYLDHCSKMMVKTIENGETLTNGTCYVTHNLSPLLLEACISSQTYRFSCPKNFENQQNVFATLLGNIAVQFGQQSIAVALTGKNVDAISGLENIKSNGGTVLAQNPDTCLQPELPRLTIQRGLAHKNVIDVDIPSVLWHVVKKRQKRRQQQQIYGLGPNKS